MARLANQLTWFAVAMTALVSLPAMAKSYKIKATAVCLDCGDTTPIPLETTGTGFATKAACEKGRRDMIAIGRNNKVEITARCVAK